MRATGLRVTGCGLAGYGLTGYGLRACGLEVKEGGAPFRRACRRWPRTQARAPARGNSPNALRSETRSRWLGKSTIAPDTFDQSLMLPVKRPDRPKEPSRVQRPLAQASRQLALLSDRTASGRRAPAPRCASRGIAGCGRLEGHGSSVIETASSATDCTRDSAPSRPQIGIARLSEGAQSGARDAVSRVPKGWRQRVSVVASPRRPRPAVPREERAERDQRARRRAENRRTPFAPQLAPDGWANHRLLQNTFDQSLMWPVQRPDRPNEPRHFFNK